MGPAQQPIESNAPNIGVNLSEDLVCDRNPLRDPRPCFQAVES